MFSRAVREASHRAPPVRRAVPRGFWPAWPSGRQDLRAGGLKRDASRERTNSSVHATTRGPRLRSGSADAWFRVLSPSSIAITVYSPRITTRIRLGFRRVHPDDRHLLRTPCSPGSPRVALYRKDGGLIWTEQPTDRSRRGEHRPIEGIARDVQNASSRRSAQASEERFRAAFGSAALGMALISQGPLLQVTLRLRDPGYTEEELLAWTSRASPIRRPEKGLDGLRRLLSGETQYYYTEKRYIHNSGQTSGCSELLPGAQCRRRAAVLRVPDTGRNAARTDKENLERLIRRTSRSGLRGEAFTASTR